MTLHRRVIVQSLLGISLLTTGCLQDEEPVPRYDYGESARQAATGKATAPRAPYDPNRAFRQLDRSGDHLVDLDEFVHNARTQPERTRRANVFHAVDRNNDGQLTPDEFASRPPEADFRNKDKDSDGVMSFPEFFQGDMNWARIEHARRVFDLTDQDSNGALDLDEFRTRPYEVWFVRTDRDGDEFLSLAEYEAANGGLVQTGRSELVFGLLDQNHDRKLALAEFVSHPLEESFYKRDRDGNDALTLVEYSVWCGTEKQRSDAAAAFEDKDYDGNGHLSLVEFKLPRHEAGFRRLDANRDGKLDLEEFAAKHATAESLARATRVFSAKDADNDGSLTLEEYGARAEATVFFEMDADADGSWNAEEFHQADMPKASPEWALRTFAIMDRNGDGKMSLDERSTRAWFMFIDADENGSISEAEYGSFNPWLVALGHCKTIFELMDRNGDGGVSSDEFNNKRPEVEFLKRDRDRDSMLSLEEFMALVASKEKTPAVMKAFGEKDIDHDGKITVEEYVATPEDRLFHATDTNHDGALNLAEYAATSEASGSETYADNLFRVRDTNGDGALQPEEYRAASQTINFARRDTDGNGAWSVEEFRQADMAKASPEWARRTFEFMDLDKDGKMTFEEHAKRTEQVWFMMIDADESGSVTVAEYETFNSWLVEGGRSKTICGLIDRNKNGAIEMDEFANRPPEVEFVKRDSNHNSTLNLEEFLARSKGKERIAADTRHFELKDSDGDGELTMKEYLASPEESRFQRLDSNGDDLLSQEEYLTGKTGDAAIRLESDLFALRDGDKDGHLTQAEFSSTSRAISFRKMDLNNDGGLDLGEFHRGDMADASVPCVQRAFGATDTNKSGKVELQEYQTRPAGAWFARMDVDLDGNLSQEEFSAANASFVATKRVEPLLALMDVNGDGNISETEYCLDSEEISFVRRDENADGRLSPSEFGSWARTPEARAEAEHSLEKKDGDHDGLLSFREYSCRPEDMDFWAFDRDNDDRLSLNEFCLSPSLVSGLSTDDRDASVERDAEMTEFPQNAIAWKRFFASVDANGDELVSFDEFRRQPLKWRFHRLDANGDGAVSVSELVQIDGIPDIRDPLASLLGLRDVNDDDAVTLQEFLGEVAPAKTK